MAKRYKTYVLKRVDNPRLVDIIYVPYDVALEPSGGVAGNLWIKIRHSYGDILGETWNNFLLCNHANLERYKNMYGIL